MRFLVSSLKGHMWFTSKTRYNYEKEENPSESILNLCIPISQIRIKLGKDQKKNKNDKLLQLSTIRETSEP